MTAAVACAPSPDRSSWDRVELEPRARVRQIVIGPQWWWAAGSIVSADGVYSPALWRSADRRRWTRLSVQSATFYGERAELLTVAASETDVVAVGAAAGKGVHGNPRRTQWYVDGDTLIEVVDSFELYGGPSMIAFRNIVHGPSGFALIGSRIDERTNRAGAAVWITDDGRRMTLLDDAPGLAAPVGQQTNGWAIAAGADRFVAVGDGFATVGSDATTHPRAWSSSDRRTWREFTAIDAGDLAASMQSVSVDGNDWTAAGAAVTDRGSALVLWRHHRHGTTRHVLDSLGVDNSASVTVSTSVSIVDGDAWIGGRLGTAAVIGHRGANGQWRRIDVGPLPSGRDVVVTLTTDVASTESASLLACITTASESIVLRRS